MSLHLSNGTPHEEAVALVENHATENLGGNLGATAACNQCKEELTINLVAGASSVIRNKNVGTVRPDISLLDDNGDPVRFIEIVDSHAPEGRVHDYAVAHGIEIMEIHLRAERKFTGRRYNRALDASLSVKARLDELASGRIIVDAHNLLCSKPKCKECGAGLPLRTVTVSTTDCWNCDQNVNIATGDKDGEVLEQDYFTAEEIAFAEENEVTLKRRFSATAWEKYLANVCPKCNEIQGNFFLYVDRFHERFRLHKTERRVHGPCDQCATRYCLTHGEYMDYLGANQCPSCLQEAERIQCSNRPDRECRDTDRCEATGCYFLNKEYQRREQQEQHKQQERLLDQRLDQRMAEIRAQNATEPINRTKS